MTSSPQSHGFIRVTPAVLAILAWAVWGSLAMGVVILTSYGMPSPAGDWAGPHVLTACIAALAMLVLAIRHGFRRNFALSRCIAEVMLITAAFMLVVPIWMLLFPKPTHSTVSFAGQTYAIPRGYAPRVHSGLPSMLAGPALRPSLSFEVCTLGPVDPFGACNQRAFFSLSTDPVHTDGLIAQVLDQAGIIVQDGKITDTGRAEVFANQLQVTSDEVATTIRLDPENRITFWLRCLNDTTEACWVGVPREDGLSAVFSVRKQGNFGDEMLVLEGLLNSWRCPDAPECVNKP